MGGVAFGASARQLYAANLYWACACRDPWRRRAAPLSPPAVCRPRTQGRRGPPGDEPVAAGPASPGAAGQLDTLGALPHRCHRRAPRPGPGLRSRAPATTGRAIERCCTTPTDRTPSRLLVVVGWWPTGRRSASTAPASRCTGAAGVWPAPRRRCGRPWPPRRSPLRAGTRRPTRSATRCAGRARSPSRPRSLALDRPAGAGRPFAFQEWPAFEPGTWASVTGEAEPVPPLGQRAADPRQRP